MNGKLTFNAVNNDVWNKNRKRTIEKLMLGNIYKSIGHSSGLVTRVLYIY